jgi:hypothetical protein
VAEHEFLDDDSTDGGVDVQPVQPYQATKTYRCPGCDHDISVGTGHVVVVPRRAPDERRHWHRACWERAARGGRGPVRRR